MRPTSSTARPRTTRRPWATSLLAAAVFVGITIGLATRLLTGLDQAVADGIAGHRSPVLYWPARAGFSLGQNWVFPLACAVVAVALAARRRTARPLLGLAGAWIAHTLVVGGLKLWAGRPPPATGDPYLHAFGAELHLRLSYPSGHAANVVVFSAILGTLLALLTRDDRWIARATTAGAVSAVVCVLCMVYLGFHWTTDALAGLVVGVALRSLLVPALEHLLGRAPTLSESDPT